MIVAELTGTVQRYARWDEPDEKTTAAAVAELREIADGRADLLAEVAGIQLGTKEGTPDEPRARNAAEFCRAAGADPDLIPGGSRKAASGRRRRGCRRSPEPASRGAARRAGPLIAARRDAPTSARCAHRGR
jgi:hypothetical protein